MPYLIVFLGVGIGGAARHAVNTPAARTMGYGFLWGTLTVNVLCSIVMGLLTEFFVVRYGLPQEVRLFMTTGLLGGLTTFSTFSLDTVSLWERGRWGLPAGYVTISLMVSTVGLFLGLSLIRLTGHGADHEDACHKLAVLGASFGRICCTYRDLRQGRSRERQLRFRHFLSYHRHPDGGGPDALHQGQLAGTVLGLHKKLALSYPFGTRHGRSWIHYFRALKLGDAARVAPIDKLSVVFVSVFAVLFLGERLSLPNWLGVATIARGTVVVAYRA